MGNSSGNLDAWAAAFEAHPAAQGGFIWDWIDQGLAAVGPRGERFFKFGGDSGETIHDAQFCVNGLLFPDRTPHPAMYEVRHVFRPVHAIFLAWRRDDGALADAPARTDGAAHADGALRALVRVTNRHETRT